MVIEMHDGLHIDEDVLELHILDRLTPNQSIIVVTHCADCRQCSQKAAKEREFIELMRSLAFELTAMDAMLSSGSDGSTLID